MEKRNTWIIASVILIFLTACSNNEEVKRLKSKLTNCQNENQKINYQKAQVISKLKEKDFTNTKLIKDIAEADIKATGITLTTAMVSIVALFINNLIWFIAYRKKK
jgi:hypothetical protein